MKSIQQIEEEFDEKFGKAGPERNSDSIGREAGCDDCPASIEIRQEHKDFLFSQISTILQEIIKKGEEARKTEDNDEAFYTFYEKNKGFNAGISTALEPIRNYLSINNKE